MKRTLFALLLILCMLPVCAWAEQIEQITITFDGNGATNGAMEAVNWQKGGLYYLPWCQYEREGHNFSGWLINGEGEPVLDGNTINVNADTKLVATWEPRIYNVHFSAGIGSDQNNSAGQLTEERYGVAFELPAPAELGFTCDHHEFIGWKDVTNENGRIYAAGDKFDGFVPECFTNLVAQWEPMQYKVTFLPGEFGKGEMADGVATYGYPYNLPESSFIAQDGYKFKAWLMNGVETPVGTSLLAEEDTTVTALWQIETYTVTYRTESGMGSVRPVEDVPHGQTVILAQPPVVDDKWVFEGWMIDGTMYSAGDSFVVKSNVTATAKWKVRDVKITYVNDAGETLLTDDSLAYGGTHRVLSLENLNAQLEEGRKLTAPEGYRFRYWQLLDDAGESINTAVESDELRVYGLWTLKPEWKQDTKLYPVVYHANGGSGTMSSVQVPENNEHTLPECGFTAPAGKSFKAWRVNDVEYAPGAKITVTEQTTVYAVWKDIRTYKLTFVDSNDTSKTFERSVGENESFVLPTVDDCGFAPLIGQVFAYWQYGSGNDVQQLDAGTSFTSASTDMVFTAVWKLNENSQTRVEQKSMETLTKEEEQKMLADMPAELDTVDEVVTRLIVEAVKNGFEEEKVEVRDVTLSYSVDGGSTWIQATEENFPTEGITIELDLPEGTNATDYEFTVMHMFTVDSERLNTRAGETETPEVAIRNGKIVVTLKGLSPVSISWKAKQISGNPPQTGDASSLMGWLALLGASGAGFAGMKRRKK